MSPSPENRRTRYGRLFRKEAHEYLTTTARDVELLRQAIETIRLDPAGRPGHGSPPSQPPQLSPQLSQEELQDTGTDGQTVQNQIVRRGSQAVRQWFANSSGPQAVEGKCVDVEGVVENGGTATVGANPAIVGAGTNGDNCRNSVDTFARSAATIELALAEALSHAATAGRWDVVTQLARELEARRLRQR